MTTTYDRAVCYGAPLEVSEIKAAGDAWSVEGYVSTYSVDHGGDQVVPGAFADTIRAWKAGTHRIRFLYSHRLDQVLGVPTRLEEDRRGLFGEFRISKTALGAEVRTLLQDKAVDAFSIGYIPVDSEQAGPVRLLKQLDLIEASIVALPMQSEALVTGVKGQPSDDLRARLRYELVRHGRLMPRTRGEHVAFRLWIAEGRQRLRQGPRPIYGRVS